MKERTDQLTACRVDCALILLPLIGTVEVERMLVAAGIRAAVIDRVINRPDERRAVGDAPYFGQA